VIAPVGKYNTRVFFVLPTGTCDLHTTKQCSMIPDLTPLHVDRHMKVSEYSTWGQILHDKVFSSTLECSKQEVTAQHTPSNVTPTLRKEDIKSRENKILSFKV